MIIPASLEQKLTNMRKLILLTLMIAALASFKTTPTRHITGIVFSNDDKQPIIGATVKVKGTNIGAVTNVNGAYVIDVPDGKDHLIFQFVGYVTKSVKIDKADTLNVYLDVATSTLNEVVVTTGYQTQKRKDAKGSVSTVKADQQLQGKVSGIAVYDKNIPANSAPVSIRGVASVKAPNTYGYTSNNVATPADER